MLKKIKTKNRSIFHLQNWNHRTPILAKDPEKLFAILDLVVVQAFCACDWLCVVGVLVLVLV